MDEGTNLCTRSPGQPQDARAVGEGSDKANAYRARESEDRRENVYTHRRLNALLCQYHKQTEGSVYADRCRCEQNENWQAEAAGRPGRAARARLGRPGARHGRRSESRPVRANAIAPAARARARGTGIRGCRVPGTGTEQSVG